MSTHTVILGAGFGGLAAAAALARSLPEGHTVTLIDRKDRFLVGAMKLWILDGRRKLGEGAADVRGIERLGVAFRQGTVEAIDVSGKTVTVDGDAVAWDHLIVALGAALTLDPIPGLADAAHNLYGEEGVAKVHQDLAALDGGRVLFVVSRPPFKCPPAPYEAAMLAKRYLEGRGIDAQVTIASPEPQPLPVAGQVCGDVVRGWVEERGVRVLSGRSVVKVVGDERLVHFDDGSVVPYDVLAAVPVHEAPKVLHEAGLVGPKGWVAVDRHTLATAHPNVWAIGDCTAIPLSVGKPLVKAGVMAEQEAEVVAANIAARARGEAETAQFLANGSCYLELGDGIAVEVVGEFYAEPAPVVAAGVPSGEALAAKVEFERSRIERWLGPTVAPGQHGA